MARQTGLELNYRGGEVLQFFTIMLRYVGLPLLMSHLAGDEDSGWNPVTDRMMLIVQRLAEQGYFYDSVRNVIIEPGESKNSTLDEFNACRPTQPETLPRTPP